MPINDKNLNMSKVVEFTMRHKIDRNTTKPQYKAMRHWLRLCARQVRHKAVKPAIQAVQDLMIYGQSLVKYENGEFININPKEFYKCQA